jgi:NO-binding membrane sensor protein with MHYT domain
MFDNWSWDWEDYFLSLLFAVVFAFVALGIVATTQTKKVDGYYLSSATNQHSGVCVNAHWTWHPDETVFCTNNKDEALDVLTRANATIK